jgi:SOS response regulatory protein OraA/RecX
VTTHSNAGVDEVLRQVHEKKYVDPETMLRTFVRIGGASYKPPDDLKHYEINEKV